MNSLEILSPHCNDGVFDSYVIQMFVESNNAFNYSYFNQFYDTTFTHGDINKALVELTGSKVIKFVESGINDTLFENFKKDYQFGKFTTVRTWVNYLFETYGLILPRSVIFNWVSKQHPAKVVSSFLPANDRNNYNEREEKKSESS